MILRAHGSSSAVVVGRQMKIRRRLGVSPGPVGLNGPVSVNVSKCGCPMVSSVSLELRMNGCRRVRIRRCAPLEERDGDRVRARLQRQAHAAALVHLVPGLGHVLQVRLEVVFAADREACTRSPSTVNSISWSYSRPRMTPRLVRNNLTESKYSPSSGSVTLARMPPTVPSGMPSMCESCDAS